MALTDGGVPAATLMLAQAFAANPLHLAFLMSRPPSR